MNLLEQVLMNLILTLINIYLHVKLFFLKLMIWVTSCKLGYIVFMTVLVNVLNLLFLSTLYVLYKVGHIELKDHTFWGDFLECIIWSFVFQAIIIFIIKPSYIKDLPWNISWTPKGPEDKSNV